MSDYALYHGEKFIDLGTIDFLANKFNFKKSTLRFYSYPANRKRNPNGYQLVKLED